MEAYAIPSQSLEIGVEDLMRVSELCTALGTKLASLIRIAFMMCIVSTVSMLCVIVSLTVVLYYFEAVWDKLSDIYCKEQDCYARNSLDLSHTNTERLNLFMSSQRV